MATPFRNLQMGFASPVGPSALRHGKYWRREGSHRRRRVGSSRWRFACAVTDLFGRRKAEHLLPASCHARRTILSCRISAFSLPESELPSPVGNIRTMARGRPVVVLSPMAYAKPGTWPTPNRALHDRYVREMAQVLSCLSRRGYLVVVACSSLGDDESVIPDLLGRLATK